MKIKLLFSVFFMLFYAIVSGESFLQKFDRAVFYQAIKSDKVEEVNDELALLNSLTNHQKEAFEGALLMRKAGLVKIPAEKLKLFKSGRIKLETILLKDSSNTEYRFLRLIIQEHAPKIVKYNKQLDSDKLYIQKSFKNLSPAVQEAIIDYSKSSKVLRREDFSS